MSSVKEQAKLDEEANDFNQPPWPEWSDSLVNNVHWESKPLKKHSSPGQAVRGVQSAADLFVDPAGLVEMPPDIPVHSWKRPNERDEPTEYVLEPESTLLNLFDHNQHLVKFKIMQVIIESITCLEREAIHRPFPIEFQSEKFVATGGSRWKPWHHVYSFTSAGKGHSHSFRFNPQGKYIVRLFYLGKWRSVMIDDQMPLSSEGKLLLPVSRPDNLWLPILTKAILKVAALSWHSDSHLVDFNVIHCLSGWMPTTVPCKGCTEFQLWSVCCNLMVTTDEVIQSPGGCVSDLAFSCPEDNTFLGFEAVSSRVIIAIMSPAFRSKVGTASFLTDVDFGLLVSNVRYNNELPNPLWKEYRWKEWAFNKGIIPDLKAKPVRCIQFYDPCSTTRLLESNEVGGPINNEAWIDFDIFISFVKDFEVYYKPSYFKYSLKAWSASELVLDPCVSDDVFQPNSKVKPFQEKNKSKSPKEKLKKNDKKNEGNPSLVKSIKSTKGTKTYKNQHTNKLDNIGTFEELPLSLYQPELFYMATDSMFCKQFYICLSACDLQKPTYAHVVFGTFDWQSPSVSPLVFRLSTSAYKGHIITLSPGLHVFRIWYKVPVHFCLQIYSNAEFSTGSKMYIQQLLSSNSVSYKHYGKEISCALEEMLDIPQGGIEHGKALDHMMNCLHPPQITSRLPWPLWLTAHTDLLKAFEESLTEMLIESSHLSSEVYPVIQSFRILFLNPAFGEETLFNLRKDHYKFIQDKLNTQKQKEVEKELETITQVSLKKGRGKSPKPDKAKKSNEKKSPSRGVEESMKSAKTEKSVKQKVDKQGKTASKGAKLRDLLQCTEKSLLLSDSNLATTLTKKIMSKVPHLRALYPFCFENDLNLVYQDYFGELHSFENWVVLVRCVFNLHSVYKVPCSVHIWAPLKNLVYRLINNETLKDVPLGFVENNVAYLANNQEGYTFCVYGITNTPTVEWRLRSIGISNSDMLHVCQGDGCHSFNAKPPEQHQQTLNGFYLPNKGHLITKCWLDVYSDVTVLVRLHLSNPSVLCSFKIYDSEETCVAGTTGIGHIIIPILKLKGNRGSKDSFTSSKTSKEYQVEVKLLKNSWPLNYDQCQAMNYYKEHLPDVQAIQCDFNYFDSKFSPNNSFSDDPEYIHFVKVDKPSWSLTIVTDWQEVIPVNLRLDSTLIDRLELLKRQWTEGGADLVYCKQLRNDFKNSYLADEESCSSEETIFHLKARRTEQLTQLYGRKTGSFSDQKLGRVSSEVSTTNARISKTSDTSVLSEWNTSDWSRKSHILTPRSSQISRVSQVSEQNTSSIAIKEDHTNLIVQQAGIHKALENLKSKSLLHKQQIFEETYSIRNKVIDEIRKAKEAESKKVKNVEVNGNSLSSPGKEKVQGSTLKKPSLKKSKQRK